MPWCPECERFFNIGARFCGACGCDLAGFADRQASQEDIQKTCPRCEEFTLSGANYCGGCGRKLSVPETSENSIPHEDAAGCSRCAEFELAGAPYCGACGSRLSAPPATHLKDSLFDKIGKIAMYLVLGILVFELAWLVVSFVDVYNLAKSLSISIYLLIPNAYLLKVLTGQAVQIYWTFVAVIIFICAAIVLMEFAKAYRNKSADHGAVRKTSLYWITVLWAASFSVEILMAFAGIALGTPVDSSWIESLTPLELQFRSTMATVWEEVVTRLLILGVPIALLTLVQTRKIGSLKMILGRFEMSKVAVVLLFVSSLVFGIAHYEGWGLMKVFMTTLGGLVHGYLFIKYGIHACILIHFINNCLNSFLWAGFGALNGVILLVVLTIGAVLAVLILIKAFEKKDWKESFISLPLIASK